MGNINELKGFTRGQIDSALMKIGHDAGMGTAEGIKAFLRGKLVASRPVRVWKTWKTIKLGTGLKTANDFRKALKAGRNIIGSWADDILGKPVFTVSINKQDIELINVSAKELGLENSASSYADICKCASELGLELCPAEVGPQLRLQWKDQPKKTFVIVAMNAITNSSKGPFVFLVGCNDTGRLDLSAHFGDDDILLDSSIRFVFIRRKSA